MDVNTFSKLSVDDKLNIMFEMLLDTNQRVKQLEVRMDRLEERMNELEKRMDLLENRMNVLEERIIALENHFKTLRREFEEFVKFAKKKISSLERRLRDIKFSLTEVRGASNGTIKWVENLERDFTYRVKKVEDLLGIVRVADKPIKKPKILNDSHVHY